MALGDGCGGAVVPLGDGCGGAFVPLGDGCGGVVVPLGDGCGVNLHHYNNCFLSPPFNVYAYLMLFISYTYSLECLECLCRVM